MDVTVVGLGKIGLPLAVQIAGKGHRVRGADISQAVVDLVNAGTEPFPGETDLDVRLKQVVADGLLTASTDTIDCVARSQAVIVVVPLVVDADMVPDFAAMDAATDAVAAGLQPGTLVCYETTIPLHTTRQRLVPALASGSGLTPGEDLFVCHSPERVYSGRIFADLSRYPKLVGGIDEPSTQRAVAFYDSILDFDERPELPQPNGVWDLGSAEAAEMAKLAETTYRDVNIALANTFAIQADRMGVDVHKVIAAANSQPYSHIHTPGVAVGGHCIPVYPRLYLAGHRDADLVTTARTANEAMPAHTVGLLKEALGDLLGRRIVVLGAAFRGGVKEIAFSGVFPVVDELRNRGAVPVVHDPLYTDDELGAMGFDAYHLGEPADGALLQADHPEYRELVPDDIPGIKALADGRNITDPDRWTGVARVVVGGGRVQR